MFLPKYANHNWNSTIWSKQEFQFVNVINCGAVGESGQE